MQKKSKRRFLFLSILLGPLAIFFAGLPLIHQGYRMATPPGERTESKSRYLELAEREFHDRRLTPSERLRIRSERMEIYYWFHARGWPIDEGWHESLIAKQSRLWGDLFKHWKVS